MALQSSGPISLNDVHKELGSASGVQCALGDSDFRTLAGVASGPIDLEDFYGASSGPGTIPFFFQMQPSYQVRAKGEYVAGAESGHRIVPYTLGDTAPITDGANDGSFIGSTEFLLSGQAVEVVALRVTGYPTLAFNWNFAIRSSNPSSTYIPTNSGWSHIDFYVTNNDLDNLPSQPTWTVNRVDAVFSSNVTTGTTATALGYTGPPISQWIWQQATLAQADTGPLPPTNQEFIGFDPIFGNLSPASNNTKVWAKIR